VVIVRNILFSFILLSRVVGFSEELPSLDSEPKQMEVSIHEKKKIFLLLTGGFAYSSVGVSFQKRSFQSGSSWEPRIVKGSPYIGAGIDDNRYHFFSKKESSWYLLGGLGILGGMGKLDSEYNIPVMGASLPLRVGKQSPDFMFDFGIFPVFIIPGLLLPCIEFRLGASF
jgi:hypothetical protein